MTHRCPKCGTLHEGPGRPGACLICGAAVLTDAPEPPSRVPDGGPASLPQLSPGLYAAFAEEMRWSNRPVLWAFLSGRHHVAVYAQAVGRALSVVSACGNTAALRPTPLPDGLRFNLGLFAPAALRFMTYDELAGMSMTVCPRCREALELAGVDGTIGDRTPRPNPPGRHSA